MTRPTYLHIDKNALLNNLQVIKNYAPAQKVIAMVKANAYGCGIDKIVPPLLHNVYAFGVASQEEAFAVRAIDENAECILFQGVFSVEELKFAYSNNFQLVIHQQSQLDWLLQYPNSGKTKVWVKINTGMNRLGFAEQEIDNVMRKLYACKWVDRPIGMFTHLACADDVDNICNQTQLNKFNKITSPYADILRSAANSAAIVAFPEAYFDVIRSGIMLYGGSPFRDKLARELDLKPVMRLTSKVMAIHNYPAFSSIGYNGTWESDKPSRIGLVSVGYADGYPRCINSTAKVWVAGNIVPIVGRISMDMLTIDLTTCKNVQIGDEVELWGQYIALDDVAAAAGTIGHEIISRVGSRVIRK